MWSEAEHRRQPGPTPPSLSDAMSRIQFHPVPQTPTPCPEPGVLGFLTDSGPERLRHQPRHGPPDARYPCSRPSDRAPLRSRHGDTVWRQEFADFGPTLAALDATKRAAN